VRELLHADTMWYPALGEIASRTSYRGPDEICEFLFEELPATLEGFTGELLEARDLGDDAVIAVGNFHGKMPRAEVEVEQAFTQVYLFRDGRVIELRSYPSAADALEAMGLRE
jgi:ketosteroid isomerase-like protein